MESIIQSDKECFICRKADVLHQHHLLAGSYRQSAERFGLKIYICPECHRQIHDNEAQMQIYRAFAQGYAMAHYDWTVDEFISHIGRSFI